MSPRFVIVAFALGLCFTGCRQRRAADWPTLRAALESPDPGARRDAARALGDQDGPPPYAVASLVEAANKEQNSKALQAMLLALGVSGAPEAKPVIDAHVEDADTGVRRAAQVASKKWRAQNGQAVRRDVVTSPAPAAGAAVAAKSTTSDGCGQFKEICEADPFDVDRCRVQLNPLTFPQQAAWAECVNASPLNCQKAHEACLPIAMKVR